MHLRQTDTDRPACGFIKLDKERIILSCNHYALDLMSCASLEDAVGTEFKHFLSFASRIFIDSYTYPMLLTEFKAEEVQLSLRSAKGVKKPIVANVEMNHDETTCWTFMSCINRDQLYTELISARDTLQSQAQTLTDLNDQIQKRQSDLQAFCQSLSHDFTGPLRRINQMIECCTEDLQSAGVDAPEPFDMLNRAQRNADTLLEMTHGLVEYLVADVPELHKESIDLEQVIETVLAMREQHENRIPKVLWTGLPSIMGSQGQIQVLFKNLIENAIKYNDRRPVIKINCVSSITSNQVVIAINDNGIGMEEEYLHTIFTPFTRLNSADKYSGSGLGLSIVRKMVENHGGNIRVESTPGTGSTFFVSLPYQASSNSE